MAGDYAGKGHGKPRLIALYFILYASMFLFGLIESIKGVSLPLVKSEFGVSYDSQGGLVSLSSFGYVAFCLVASLFLQRFGLKKSMLVGYFLVCAGAAVATVVPSFWMASLTFIMINAGFGFLEVATNALGTVAFTSKAALLMGLLHFFYGFGSIVGPKAAGLLTSSLSFSWRQVYITTIVPVAALALFALSTRFDRPRSHPNGNSRSQVSFLSALRNPVVWLFSLTLGFMEVVEFGAVNWGALYLQDVYQLDPRTVGASFVSAFYVMFTLSRLLSGLAIEKAGYVRSLYISAVCTIAAYLIGFALGRNGIWALPFTGLFIAIMWPTMMAVAMKAFGPDAPVVTSAIITISGAINAVVQLIIGFTGEILGEAWGYRGCLLYAVVVLLSLRQLDRALSRRSNACTTW